MGKGKGKNGQKPEMDVTVSDSVYVCVSVCVGVSVGGIGCNAKYAFVLTGIGQRIIVILFVNNITLLF